MEKTKVCVWLDSDLHIYLNEARGEELTIPQYIRLILKQKMKSANKRKPKSVASDPFSYYIINSDVIPDDLKEYSDLLIEWWPIRKKKGASCTLKVANRIFDTLSHFHHKIEKKLLKRQLRLAGRIYIHLRKVTNQKNQKIIIQHQEYLQQKEVLNNAKII